MSKNIRKNKTNLVVNWPDTTYFTIKDMFKANPGFVPITLRVRITKAIDELGTVAEIGTIPSDDKIGRPQKVLAKTPVTDEVLDKAEANGVTLVEKAREKFVNVVTVSQPTAAPAVVASQKPVAV